ncbi:MAG: putative PEP-binding protein, partial [Nanoarchaeota archaeon]
KGFPNDKSYLAVVIQKMIDSEKSGVIFSRDPVNTQKEDIIIEAVYGQGEGIVSGAIKPDHYIVSRDLDILEKNIADKKIAITRNSSGESIEIRLTQEKSNSQVLKDFEIKKLADYSIKLEDHYNKPQDIEFALESGDIYILQTRPITTLHLKQEKKDVKGEIILNGLAASGGIASGQVRIVHNLQDLDKIKKGDVLVTKMTNPDMVVAMQRCSAIVTDEGGVTAHAAIVSREMGIPAVVGTQKATSILQDGEIITVDGFNGKVYKGKTYSGEQIKKEILPALKNTNLKIKLNVDLPSAAERASKTGLKSLGLVRLEGIIAEHGKHPLHYLNHNKISEYEDVIYNGLKKIMQYFDEAWVRTSDIRTDEFQYLESSEEVEANPMLGMHGIRFSLKNKEILKAELNALTRVANEGKKIGVMLPQIISVEEVLEVKSLLNNKLKLGAMIETPAAVQIIEELCESGIEFISFGTNDLTQYTLAIDRGNEQVQYLYNELHPAILSQIELVIILCKQHNIETSICGQAANNEKMVEFLLEIGIDGISVNADSACEISQFVKNLENKIKVPENEEQPEMELAAVPSSNSEVKKVVFQDPRISGIIQEYLKQKEIDNIIKGMQMLFGEIEPEKKDYKNDPISKSNDDEILDIF